MKKQINILLVLFLTIILSSCFTSKEDIDQAKKNLGIIEGNDTNSLNDKKNGIDEYNNFEKDETNKEEKIIIGEESINEDEVVEKKVKKIEIKSLTDNQFLELDDLSGKNLLGGEIEITGKTLGKVDKIIVHFANETSDFPIDKYTLKQFIAGSDTFLYRAFSRYETLDFGKNTYILEAYSGNEISKLELILNVFEEDKEEISENNDIYEDINLGNLPVNEKYGTPVDLGDGKISYSDLNGLEIKRDINPKLTCENVTSVLADKIEGWFFWNTCRPIEDKEGVSFYIVRLDNENYFYEKHYYLPYQGLYGIQELENGTGVTNTNIGEKNNELKEKNSDYTILEITDELFKEILN